MLPQNFVSAGLDFATYQKSVPAPIFRKVFSCKNINKANVIIGATGFYDLYINGEKITDGFLAPFISNADEIVFYDEYDLSEKLIEGDNVLCVILGNGFANPIGGDIWQHGKGRRSAPAFALCFDNGDFLFDASHMKWNYSHILFDDLRCGTYCDMTKYNADWHSPSFDDSSWNEPMKRDYSHSEKVRRTCPPVRAIRSVYPVEIEQGELRDYRIRDSLTEILYAGETMMEKTPTCGGYIYDFGENCAGVPKLKIKGKRGQKIQMQFCEVAFEGFPDYINIDVYPDGCCQKDVYICGGDGVEEYIPPFTYHGFRYCYIYGITNEQANKDLLTMLVIHNDIKEKTEFCCSDDISEKIIEACKRSDLSNIVNNITDCPAREKNGWTGDAAISAEHLIQNFDVESVFEDWLLAFRHTMDDDGRLPLLIPCSSDRYDYPIWDSAIVFLPYYTYIYTGNTKVIKDNACAMLKNFKMHLALRDERGISERGFGDWLPVDKAAADYDSPLGFCCSCILLLEAQMMSTMFSAIGMREESDFANLSLKELRDSVRKEYNDNGVIGIGRTEKYRKEGYRICQTSQVLGLQCGIFDDGEIDTAVHTLVRLIKENNNSFDCGFLGLRYIFRVLSRYGYSDMCYEMITKPAHPSYANMIYRGNTSVWERFVKPHGRTGSYNHHFMADISGWYIESVAGIVVNPQKDDCNMILIDPKYISKLDHASGTYRGENGEIFVGWHRDGEKIYLDIKNRGNFKIKVAENILKNSNVEVRILELFD